MGIVYGTNTTLIVGFVVHWLIYKNRKARKLTFSHVRPKRPRSAYDSAQSDHSLRCLNEDSLHPWLSKIRPVKILIRLRECAG